MPRVASVAAFVLILAGILFWHRQTSETPNGAVVRAGAPADEVHEAPSAPNTSSGVTQSGEQPVLGPESPSAVPSNADDLPEDKPDGDASNAADKELTRSAQSASYSWHDGDRTIQVWFDPNLVVQPDADGISRDDVVSSSGEATKGRGESSESAPVKGDPVFWSNSGELMALPGGAVVVLDPSWDAARADAFFERNGIDSERLSALGFVANGFYIETEPGFASLSLANSLASQPGVELASPDWWVERVTK